MKDSIRAAFGKVIQMIGRISLLLLVGALAACREVGLAIYQVCLHGERLLGVRNTPHCLRVQSLPRNGSATDYKLKVNYDGPIEALEEVLSARFDYQQKAIQGAATRPKSSKSRSNNHRAGSTTQPATSN